MACFNTSHVVIYQYLQKRDSSGIKFQYISCCYLSYLILLISSLKFVSIHLMLLFIQITMRFPHLVIQFQYISCCYLSRYFLSILAICRSFNTSHVVIYQHSDWFIFSGTMFQYISCCYLSD